MTPQEILALVQAANVLIEAGVATAHTTAAAWKTLFGTAQNEEQLNAACEVIIDDAARRKMLADADAAAAQAEIDERIKA